MPTNCALSSWWYDVLKMIGNKITLKFVFSIHLNVLKNCLDDFMLYFVCLFVCLCVFFLFSVISTVLFQVQTQITL